MAWSWSHTDAAYANAASNLHALPANVLECIYAEWRAAQGKGGVIDYTHPAFDTRKYDRALAYAVTLPMDQVVEFIWERASEMATCENGGHEAWMCPYGCGPHRVSFDAPVLKPVRLSRVCLPGGVIRTIIRGATRD